MKLITREEITQLLKEVCTILSKSNLDYLVYGSLGYQLLTGDKNKLARDIDIVVRQEDFPKLVEILPALNLNPIRTPFAIHANSLTYQSEDNKPFDISLDSHEHYFAQHNISLNDYVKIPLEETMVRVIKPEDLIKVYKVGLKGSNTEKLQDYKNKIQELEKLNSN